MKMKVKKESPGDNQVANQNPTTAVSRNEAQNPAGDGQTFQRQVSLDPGDLDVTFMDMMNDPQFLSMIQGGYYPPSAANPFPYAPDQFPPGQYGSQFGANYLPMDYYMDDDDDDDDDDEFLMSLNPQPFPTKTNLTQQMPVQRTTQSAKSDRTETVSSSVAHSPVSQDLTGSMASSPQSSTSGAVVKVSDYSPAGATSPAGIASGDLQQAGPTVNISDMHSYSLPVMVSNTTTASGNTEQILYTDSDVVLGNAVAIPVTSPVVQFVTREGSVSPTPVVISDVPMETSQAIAVAMNTSPVTSPHPSVGTMPASSPKSKSSRSSASKSKAKDGGTTSARKKKTKTVSEPITYTPVETITDIVGPKLEENEIYKEVLAKPIKHQVEINVDKAHNRSVKNAINARVNRQKHKQFVQTLEEENTELKEKITDLESVTDQLRTEKDVLQQEIRYLKSVIANETTIGNVLSGLGNIKDVRLSSGFAKQYRKRAADSTVNNSGELKRTSRDNDVMAGVCLHVHSDNVSVEFCEQCASMAASGR